MASAAFAAGAVVGNDISGFADPDYLAAAAEAGASVVATHIRLAPRVADPNPHYDDLVGEVLAFLVERAARAEAAGIPRERIMVDAGLDLGKTEPQSLELLRASDRLAGLGYVAYLSASTTVPRDAARIEVGSAGASHAATPLHHGVSRAAAHTCGRPSTSDVMRPARAREEALPVACPVRQRRRLRGRRWPTSSTNWSPW